jgi:hypothetical protein
MKSISSRIACLDARIRDTVCPQTIASLVRAMTSELDPEAIPVLIGLLDHDHDDLGSVRDALLQYGDSAVDSLRAHVAATRCAAAESLLEDLAYRARLSELGCF